LSSGSPFLSNMNSGSLGLSMKRHRHHQLIPVLYEFSAAGTLTIHDTSCADKWQGGCD
jgi:hypothetical protein